MCIYNYIISYEKMITRGGLKSEFWDVSCYLKSGRMWKVVIWCQLDLSAGFGWAGLIFFPVAGGGCVWVCAEHGGDNPEMFLSLLSGACTEPRPFCFSSPHWGGVWGAGDTARTDQGTFRTTGHLLSTYSRGKKGEERTFGVLVFVLPSHHYTRQGSALLGMAERLPSHGKQGFIPCFAFLASTLCVPC